MPIPFPEDSSLEEKASYRPAAGCSFSSAAPASLVSGPEPDKSDDVITFQMNWEHQTMGRRRRIHTAGRTIKLTTHDDGIRSKCPIRWVWSDVDRFRLIALVM